MDNWDTQKQNLEVVKTELEIIKSRVKDLDTIKRIENSIDLLNKWVV